MSSAGHFRPQVQVPARSYRDRLGLTNFLNASCQVQDCLRFDPRRVLIVGKGLGLEVAILRQFGIEVTVVDIDPALEPDVVTSVDELGMFRTGEFDVVIAAHVLEHLPFERFSACCSGLSRVARHALVYLPCASLVPEISFSISPLFKKSLRLDIPLFWKTHHFNGEHYWELGTRGYTVKRICKELAPHFSIVERYRNWDWKYSYNFVLRSQRHD